MSTVTTWLTLVFDDSHDEAWFTVTVFDEEHANAELARLHISTTPGRRERHLRYQLEQPLAPEQLASLTELKELGLFRNFYVVDEITAESAEK
jgi:hypothetical protein